MHGDNAEFQTQPWDVFSFQLSGLPHSCLVKYTGLVLPSRPLCDDRLTQDKTRYSLWNQVPWFLQHLLDQTKQEEKNPQLWGIPFARAPGLPREHPFTPRRRVGNGSGTVQIAASHRVARAIRAACGGVGRCSSGCMTGYAPTL